MFNASVCEGQTLKARPHHDRRRTQRECVFFFLDGLPSLLSVRRRHRNPTHAPVNCSSFRLLCHPQAKNHSLLARRVERQRKRRERITERVCRNVNSFFASTWQRRKQSRQMASSWNSTSRGHNETGVRSPTTTNGPGGATRARWKRSSSGSSC